MMMALFAVAALLSMATHFILLPFFFVRAWVARTRREALFFIFIIAVSAVHLYASLSLSTDMPILEDGLLTSGYAAVVFSFPEWLVARLPVWIWQGFFSIWRLGFWLWAQPLSLPASLLGLWQGSEIEIPAV